MEKRTPHCELAIIRRLIAEGKVRATFMASRTAKQLGFDFDGMVSVVLTLTPKDFYKSMTTYVDSKVWQDVYHPATKSGDVYLKLTVVDDVLIVSFKEL
jgi:motility quorum-sensing regulator/GCU-specific mRNA interferase toxin